MTYTEKEIIELFGKNKNAVGYIRVDNGGEASDSIRMQEHTINMFCKKLKIKCENFYKDIGVSGLNFKRTAWKEMLKNEKNKVVLVANLSRISRKFEDLLKLNKDTDKIFISINDGLLIKK